MRGDFGLLSSCLSLSDCESLPIIDTTGLCTGDAYLHGPPIINTSCPHTTAWGVDLDIGCTRHAGVSYTNSAPHWSVQGMRTSIPAQNLGLTVNCVQNEDVLNEYSTLSFGVFKTKADVLPSMTYCQEAHTSYPVPYLRSSSSECDQLVPVTKSVGDSSIDNWAAQSCDVNSILRKINDVLTLCYDIGIDFVAFAFDIQSSVFRSVLSILRCMSIALRYGVTVICDVLSPVNARWPPHLYHLTLVAIHGCLSMHVPISERCR